MKPKIEKKVVHVKNPNHPKKGESIRVEPIREPKDIWAIKKILADSPRVSGNQKGTRIGPGGYFVK
jgi:hypothetical protein